MPADRAGGLPGAACAVAPLAAEEQPPRPSKSALLPEIARLALAGHSGREIGKRRNVAITPVDKKFPLKVEDALFSPRIPDGGIAPMDMALYITGVRKEPKSR